jgi:hypothetical protein
MPTKSISTDGKTRALNAQLGLAAERGDLNGVMVAHINGATINSTDEKKRTPLMRTAAGNSEASTTFDRERVAMYLLDFGAGNGMKDYRRIAADLARESGRLGLANTILTYAPNPAIHKANGRANNLRGSN